MVGTRVRKEHDERREQILSCARKLFQSRPYQQVSAREIAEAAGVSRGLLNHYFGTKRELYLAAVEQMLKAPAIHVPAYVPGASVEDRVVESVAAWMDLLERYSETWLTVLDRVAADEDAQLAGLLEQSREAVIDRITEVVGLSREAAVHPEIRAALHAYSGFAQVASREWLRFGRLDREQTSLLLRTTLLSLVEVVIPRLIGESSPVRQA